MFGNCEFEFHEVDEFRVRCGYTDPFCWTQLGIKMATIMLIGIYSCRTNCTKLV